MSSRYDATLSNEERKRHGVFYTPLPVVQYLLRATAPTGPVADISCGDGAFLVEAARLGCPVMGIDRDEAALQAAQAELSVLPDTQCQLRCGNGLLAELPWIPDVVLGNPPYLEAKKSDRDLKSLCRTLFPQIARGGFDIYVCFLKAGLDLLPPGGRLGYILPNKFLIAEYARPLREELLRDTTIEEIVDVSDLPTFRDAAVYPVMLVVRKSPPPPNHQVRTGHVRDLAQLVTGDFPRGQVPQARWHETGRSVFWLPPAEAAAESLTNRLLADSQSTPLRNLLDVRWSVSFHRAGLRDAFIFPEATGANPRRLLGGKRFHGNADVRRYRINWSGWWIDYDEAKAKALRNQFPPLALYTNEKILIAQNARRIIATLDRDGYVCKDTFLVGRQCGDVPLSYLLGILNSSLLSYLYSILFKATHVSGAYLHYLGCYLEDLPIRIASDPSLITDLVERLLSPTLSTEKRAALDTQLDQHIFDLYELTNEERHLVHAAVPMHWGDDGVRRGRWDARTNVQ